MKNKKRRILVALGTIVILIAGIIYYYFFTSLTSGKDTHYIYIDEDDNIDSVYAQLQPVATNKGMTGFRTLVRHSQYDEHIRTGRYAIKPGESAFTTFRKLKNGIQEPVMLVIPCVRTMDRLAGTISKKMMVDSLSLYRALSSQNVCEKLGYDTTTIACMFIPNTYEVFWNMPIEKFLERMQKESKKFWTKARTQKAKDMGLTHEEVITLASIVDEETSNDAEKPVIAGLYYNRLMLRNSEYPDGMPLQADPTIKFALKRFELKRIYTNMLRTQSPYNTYLNAGLPPGPIRIPTIAGIDAVLNYDKHDYLYMCAKEDLSGTHNFAATYQEHLANAAKYAKALNERGIK